MYLFLCVKSPLFSSEHIQLMPSVSTERSQKKSHKRKLSDSQVRYYHNCTQSGVDVLISIASIFQCFDDGTRRIDFILCYEITHAEKEFKASAKRQAFEENLKKIGLVLEYEPASVSVS